MWWAPCGSSHLLSQAVHNNVCFFVIPPSPCSSIQSHVCEAAFLTLYIRPLKRVVIAWTSSNMSFSTGDVGGMSPRSMKNKICQRVDELLIVDNGYYLRVYLDYTGMY